MDNQNIYSSENKGFVIINRKAISDLGLSDKPFLRTVYLLLIERSNYKDGTVLFSKRFAAETLAIGIVRYRKTIEELINLNLITKIETGKGFAAKFKVNDYFKVTKQ